MSSSKQFSLIIFGLTTCLLIVLSQLHTLAMSKPSGAESSQVKIAYDKTKNETTESTRILTVVERPGTIEARFPEGTRNLPSETLRMTAYFSYSGRTFVKPESVMLGFLSLVQDETKYRDTDEVTVQVDGQSLNLGKLRVVERGIDTHIQLNNVSYWRETLELSVKTPEFLRIANARKVTVQLGKTEFRLSDEHMKPLRALAQRVGA
jgi:hypothetical protein